MIDTIISLVCLSAFPSRPSLTSGLLPQNKTMYSEKSSLDALYLVDLDHTTIQVMTPISSSIHVTNCIHCIIQHMTCQQIRIHTSSHVEFHIQSTATTTTTTTTTTGGAILEDSHDILFSIHVVTGTQIARLTESETNDDDNKNPNSSHHDISLSSSSSSSSSYMMDVKDFNWLRQGIPSPNFRVVVEQSSSSSLVLSSPLSSSTTTATTSTTTTLLPPSTVQQPIQDNESSTGRNLLEKMDYDTLNPSLQRDDTTTPPPSSSSTITMTTTNVAGPTSTIQESLIIHNNNDNPSATNPSSPPLEHPLPILEPNQQVVSHSSNIGMTDDDDPNDSSDDDDDDEL